MRQNILGASAWQTAWADYVEALKAFEAAEPSRLKPELRRAWRTAARRYRDARRRMRRLDPEFCDRVGITQ